MATQAKVIIKGQNNIGQAVKSASNDLGALKSASEKLGSAIKAAFTVTAVVASIKKLSSAISSCFDQFSKAERSYKQLAMAIGDQEGYDKLVSTIASLSRQTLVSKDNIESVVAELAALGKSADEIDAITTASVNLSNVTGKDLTSSMTTLLNTYNGTTTQLKKLGIDTSALTKEELAQGGAVELVNKQLGEYTKKMAKLDTSQHLTNVKNTWGDICQTIGGVVDYNFGPFLSQFDTWLANSYSNITGVINYVGAIIANAPQAFRLALDTIWTMIKRVFEWDSIKSIIQTVMENTQILLSNVLTNFFTTIPTLLSTLGEGIIAWIAYIGSNLRQEISTAIGDGFSFGFLEAIKNPLSRLIFKDVEVTYKGKTQPLGDYSKRDQNAIIDEMKKLGLAVFGTMFSPGANIEAKSETWAGIAGLRGVDGQKEAADKKFAEVGNILKNLVTDSSVGIKEIITNTGELGTTLFGDIATEFKSSLDEIVAPVLSEIANKSDVTIPSFVIPSGIKIDASEDEDDGSEDDGTEDKPKLKFNLTDLKTWFGEKKDSIHSTETFDSTLYSRLESVFGGLLSSIEPILTIVQSTSPHLALLMPVVEGFVSVLGNALSMTIQPIFDALTMIGQMLGSLFLPILDAIYPVVQILSSILINAMLPVIQILSPAFEAVGTVIKLLTPIITLVGKAFTILSSPVQYVADLFGWLGEWLKYLGSCVAVAAWNLTHWFDQRSYGGTPGGFSSDAFSGLDSRLNQWDSMAMNSSAISDSTSTSTAIGSASYQGGTSVTINIYQEAPVVGDGGMKDFARMIRSEFDSLNYYGVTT